MSTKHLERISEYDNFQKWSFGRFPEDFPKGAWSDEPDKVQWIDPATGLDCLIVRNRWGALCGYVGVSPGHSSYNVNYDDVDVHVHGGLTFSNFCSPGEEVDTISHTPGPGRPDKVWWLGFDCGHAFDVQPLLEEELRGLLKDHPDLVVKSAHETYRDVDYVIGEIEDLAKQLA